MQACASLGDATTEVPLTEIETTVLEPDALEALVAALCARGYRVLGPKLRDGAIVYDDLGSAAELPIGWTDTQQPGRYRVERRDDAARFGYAVGPHSWKQFLLPARLRIWRARRDGEGFEIDHDDAETAPPLAFVGVRGCELSAIAIQDRVLLGGRHVDTDYAQRRDGVFVVAVDCFAPADTCFCVSMGGGPRVAAGYDLALSEILDGEHRFLARAGSERGAELLRELPRRRAAAEDVAAADAAVEGAARRMTRTVESGDLRDLLARNLENPRWEQVAERCLTCGNCTMVCPTCFCTNVEDVSDLAGTDVERVRLWESCFAVDHSFLHGGSVRRSGRSRYRQWLTHKFGTWHDQFDSSGCVGCGRCIAWCPVGIDVTEELAAIRASDGATV
jgi:sulfhydrogenase subunit beta (sulfur reductase)